MYADWYKAFKHRRKYRHSNKRSCSWPVLQLNIGMRQKQFQSTKSFDGSHTHTWQCIDFYLFIYFFLLLPLPPSSAGYADRAVWRNPLSRHFSFPLTDRPWRAWAFGPPAWLAARQLNKLSSCYNSLKHFQLPQSNKSCRRALGCFSTSNPTPQRVLFHLSFGLSADPPCYNEEEEFFWTKPARFSLSVSKLYCLFVWTYYWIILPSTQSPSMCFGLQDF